MGIEAFVPVIVALVGSLFPLYIALREQRAKKEEAITTSKTATLSEIHQMLREQIKDKEADIVKLETRIASLDEKIESQRIQISQLRDEVDSLKRENGSLKWKLERLPEEL